MRPFSDRPGEEYVPAWQALPVQPERRLGRPIERTRRSSSFTALVAGRTRLSLPQVQGRDLDEHLISVRGTVTESASEIVPLADFPRGAKPGDFLHRVLEVYDFQSDAAALSEIVREQLALSGFEAHWEPVVVDALQYVVRAPLSQSTPELSLFSIPKARRLNELEFTFPVRSSVEEGAAISSAELASVLARHPEPPWEDDYPERIRQLGFTPLRGFLRGFIDLVFEYEGRWYLVDYKSNHLGASFEDYSQARLREVLAEHHYLFQYHVYVVALHRYLQHRIPGYDYDRHFGGVFYLFLRGMDARYGPGQAVFADRPPKLLVTELSRLFERATTQNAELRNPEEST